MARYFLGFLLAVGLIVVVVILIVRSLSPHKGPAPLDLPSYANSSVQVQLTIDSPVTAGSSHGDIIMTVGSSQSTILVTNGYDNSVTTMKTYPMTTNAYAVFLRALSYNGFTKGTVSSDSTISDERGHCAEGDRYIYEILDSSGNDLERYWYSSCNMGTFKGSPQIIQQLFIAQFPDYSTVTSSVSL